jgi:hypothetical protein
VTLAFPAFVSPAGVSDLLRHMSALEEVAGAVRLRHGGCAHARAGKSRGQPPHVRPCRSRRPCRGAHLRGARGRRSRTCERRVHTTAPKEVGRSGTATAERGKYTRDVFFWWWCRGGHISCCPLQCHPVLQCCNFSSDMDDRPKGLLISYEYESLNLHTSLSRQLLGLMRVSLRLRFGVARDLSMRCDYLLFSLYRSYGKNQELNLTFQIYITRFIYATILV